MLNREEWVAAIKLVADRLAAESEDDVDMLSHSDSCDSRFDVSSMDELGAKFSVQGTSSSKSSGKKKVVSIPSVSNTMSCHLLSLKLWFILWCTKMITYSKFHYLGLLTDLKKFINFLDHFPAFSIFIILLNFFYRHLKTLNF